MTDSNKVRFVRLVTQKRAADPALRPKMVEEARAERSSLTAVAIRILAETYRVAYEPTGRIGRAGEGDVLLLSIPHDLDRAIAVEAAAHGRSVSEEILVALSAHYGLAAPQPLTVAAA